MTSVPCPLCSLPVALTALGEHCHDGRCRRCKVDIAVVDLRAGVSIAVHEDAAPDPTVHPDDVVPAMVTVLKDVGRPENRQPVPTAELKLSRKRAAGSRRAS